MSSLQQQIQEAIQLHQAGRFSAAEAIYRQVLAADPNHVDALQLLGLIAHQSGRSEIAITYIRRAIERGGQTPEIYCNLGAAYLGVRQTDEAIAQFREAIRRRPDFALGHHNLAEALRKNDQANLAVHSYREAIRLNPNWALAHYGLALAYDSLQQFAEAVASYRRAIAINPKYHEAWNGIGNIAGKLGKFDDAAAAYREAIRINPDFAEGHNNIGTILQHEGKHDEAVTCYRRALELNPNSADAHCNLGAILPLMGKTEEALRHLHEAARLQPKLPEVHANLAALLQRLGRADQSIAAAKHALELRPNMTAALVNLGGAYESLGQLANAEAAFRQAIQAEPASAAAHSALGTVLKNQGRLDEAEAACRKAIRCDAGYADAYNNLGNVLQEQARTSEARESFQQAYRLSPRDGLKVKAALLMPVIVDSVDEILRERRQIAECVDRFTREGLSIEDPTTEVGMTAFHLAYHGLDNRALQIAIARMHLQASPALSFTAPHCSESRRNSDGRIRVGFLSKFFSNHPITKHWSGMLREISRDQFHVTLLRTAAPHDADTRKSLAVVDQVVTLSRNLVIAQQEVAAQKLDVLIYTDIGMDPFTYFLAFARLAPVQGVFSGHPDTTGIPAIDYFLSAAGFESHDADNHYSERLVRLAHPPTFYEMPQFTTPPPTRNEFGLPESGRLYVCGQTLFKLHPDFDAYLAGILQADPQGCVVLFSDAQRQWNGPLIERLRSTAGSASERIHFIPRQPLEKYRHLLAMADAVLDTIYFNGGTTTLDAFGVGAPVITQPGEFLRGRMTAGCYWRMNVDGCVANSREEYVRLAVRLANDRDWHKEVQREIIARRASLYSNLAAVRNLEAFLQSVAREPS